MSECMNEAWPIAMKLASVQWASSFWGGRTTFGASSRRGLLCSPRLQAALRVSRTLPKTLRSRPRWWERLRVLSAPQAFGHESCKRNRTTSQGRPKAKQASIINCRVCCPRFVEDLSGLISSRGAVMCVSNCSFKLKHYLYHRALRGSLWGLWEGRGLKTKPNGFGGLGPGAGMG